MCEEACSIQTLLHEYTEKTRTLGREVGGFMQRDSAEEDALQKIVLDVARAEMSALRDVRYMEFSHRRGEMGSARDTGGADTCSSSTRRGCGGCVAGCVASLCDGRPDAFFELFEYGDVGDVLLGWRSATRNARVQFDALCASVIDSVPDISSCVLLVNGILYTPCDAFDACELTERELETILGGDGGVVAEEALVRWQDAVVMRSLLTCDRLRGVWNAAGGSEGSGLCLMGDGHDTLALVDHTRLLRSAVFRGFFFSGELRAVESVGAQANVLATILGASDGDSQEEMERCVVDVFTGLQRQEGHPLSGCKNAVVMLAVQGDVPAAAPAACGRPLVRFVVLDIRPLAPNLPFAWHFTWAEVCALGQLDARTGAGHLPTPLPVFKMTRVAVAALEPYDTLSRRLFPVLNGYLRGIHRRRRDAVASPMKLSAAFSVVSIVFVSAVVVVVSVVSAGLLRGRPFHRSFRV
ncbi:hypothetical protein DQ04_02931000 [Trypanosoma grayi]|uniref:hypothetical protein n=1 Tax=Trypanosoma grayi TaxID=71804 RepID=UPI0004F4934E|nr:hypothetical protein DQ04_02931000 [Trypanosoma grayi]KEG11145.1 hypothetical protein DQ04_02931000 [Trypanosoma grayi]